MLEDNTINSYNSITTSKESTPLLFDDNKKSKEQYFSRFPQDDSLPFVKTNSIDIPNAFSSINDSDNPPSIEDQKSSLKSAGIISSSVNLTLATIGAGILGFPFVFRCTGIALGLFLTISLLLMTISSLHILGICSTHVKAKTYQETVLFMLGTKWSIINELFLLFYSVGACVVYLTVIADAAGPMFQYWFPGKWYNDRKFIISLFSVVIVFPLCLLKRIQLLSSASVAGILCSIYSSLFICVMGITSIANGNVAPEMHYVVNPSLQILQALPIITFAFQCHVSLPPIQAEMKNGSLLNLDIVIVISLITSFLLEGSVAVFGYLNFGSFTNANIMLNYPRNNLFAGIGRMAMAFVATVAYPLANFSARLTVKSLVFKRWVEFPDWIFYTVTILWFLFTLLLALFVPGLDIVFGFTGAIACTAVMFTFPGAMLIKLSLNYGSKVKKVLGILYGLFLIVFGVFVMLSGTFVSIVKLILGDKWHEKLYG